MNDDSYLQALERLTSNYNRLNITLHHEAVPYYWFLLGCLMSYCMQSSMINKATRHTTFFADLNGIIEL